MNTLLDQGVLRSIKFTNGDERRYWSGHEWQLGTAAYWESAADLTTNPPSYRLGTSLIEELAACIIGGFGMTWDIVQPYLERLRVDGVLDAGERPSPERVEALLRNPVVVDGRARRYRFPRQRSMRLCAAFDYVSRLDTDALEDRELRNALSLSPGIGLKTASWIVRNLRSSNAVAIIDIHVARAGVVAGVFDSRWHVARDYMLYEEAFLSWSHAGNVGAAKLDAVIWSALSGKGSWSRQILGTETFVGPLDPVWPAHAS